MNKHTCPNCGIPVPDQARFCAHCGHAFEAPPSQQPSSGSALPNSPQSGKDQQIELQRTTLLPPPLPPGAQSAEKQINEDNPHPSAVVPGPARPAKAQQIEEQKTLAFPSPPKVPAVENIDTIEVQKPRAYPPAPPRRVSSQKQLILPAEKAKPNAPPDLVRAATPRRTQPGGYPRVDTPGNQTNLSNRKMPPTGDLRPRNAPTRSRQLSSTAPTTLLPPPGWTGKIQQLIWRSLAPTLRRAQDLDPEKIEKPLPQNDFWLFVTVLLSALGLFIVATAYNLARQNEPGAELVFWLGLGLIFVPVLIRLIFPRATRLERIIMLCVVALGLYLVRVELSPLHFSGYDEFLHWRTVNDIMSSGHLFAKNPLLPVSPYYPGLEIITSAISTISGLSTFQAGLIVVGAASLFMALSLYLLCELLSSSSRLASIATIIYMTNPHYLLFDHQFAYESLALPLATFVLFAMARYEVLNKSRPWILLIAWLVLTAMDVTHHATNFVFEGLFLLWGAIYLFLRPLPLRKSIVTSTIVFGLVLTATTVLLIGNTVISYFTSFFADIGSEISQSLDSSGNSGSRQLFATAGVAPTPLWERLLPLCAVGLITLAIPFLLFCFWRRYRRNTLVWVFAMIVVFYPVLQVLRLTSSGAELSDRTSAFVFIPISFLAAVAIVQFWPLRWLKWHQPLMISTAILVLFLGGIILGDGIPPSFLPGPYEVSADARSIDPQGIQAALWARTYLGPNNRMYTDRINQLLMSGYGEQYLVTKIGDNIDETDVFFSPVVSSYEISLLQKGNIHYLVVDMRLSTGLPQDGFYFEAGEPNANAETTPMNPRYLTKFDSVKQMNRLFDSGSIAIYDTGGLLPHH